MSKPTEQREATYTTAPIDYDYTGFGTVNEGPVGMTDKGKVVRKVTTFLSKTDYQRGRYGSGLHLSADEAEFKKLVDYGFIKLQEDEAG